jgi:hypothetical protein
VLFCAILVADMNFDYLISWLRELRVTKRTRNKPKLFPGDGRGLFIDKGVHDSCYQISREGRGGYLLTVYGILLYRVKAKGITHNYFVHRREDPQRNVLFFVVSCSDDLVSLEPYSFPVL